MFNLPRNCPLSLLVLWSAGIKLSQMRDFPGGPIIQNPPSNAGNVGSIPCQETKMPHAEGQLNPRTPQLGSSRAITKTPHRQKIKKNKKKNCFLKKKIESDEEFILKELTAGLIDQFKSPCLLACLLMCYQNNVTLEIYSFTTG